MFHLLDKFIVFLTHRTSSKHYKHIFRDKLAVMVFFHGGGYVLGSGHQPLYDGKIMAALGNVIVVTVNYRLNVFGFLYSGGPEAPGNVAIMDQQLALQWIRRNIGN